MIELNIEYLLSHLIECKYYEIFTHTLLRPLLIHSYVTDLIVFEGYLIYFANVSSSQRDIGGKVYLTAKAIGAQFYFEMLCLFSLGRELCIYIYTDLI